MSEDSLLSYIIVAVVFYFFGRWVGRMSAIVSVTRAILENKDDIKRVLELHEAEIKDIRREEGHPEDVKVEKHGEQIFLYTKDNDEFISQGSTLKEALDRAAKRFPERSFRGLISKAEAESMGINASQS